MYIYDVEREEIVTSVSKYGLQEQSNEDKLRSNEVSKSTRLHIEHLNHMIKHKTIQTRTFPTIVAIRLKVPTNRFDGRSDESKGGAR